METTIMGYIGVILGYILALYLDHGQENGNYHLGFGFRVLKHKQDHAGFGCRGR